MDCPDDPQVADSRNAIEVRVGMQQWNLVTNADRRDQTITGATNDVTSPTRGAVDSGSTAEIIQIPKPEDRKLRKPLLELSGTAVVPNALE